MAEFIFNKTTSVSAPLHFDGKLFSELFYGFTNRNCVLKVMNERDDFSILIGECETAYPKDDAEYAIKVSEKGIFIGSNTKEGVIHGLSELLLMIKNDKNKSFLFCDEYEGKPSIAFRGVHICVFPETTLDYLKKTLRTCCILKATHIIIEFWGMLKYDILPALSWPFAFSKDDIKKLVEECRSLGAEIIPMFNHLGHASGCRVASGKHVVLDQDPSLEYLFEGYGWNWRIDSEEVYSLLSSIRKELCDVCGKSEYFHIGCDESYSTESEEDQAPKFANYINRIANDLQKEGRRAIIWGDMFLPKRRFSETGERYSCNMKSEELSQKLLSELDKSIIIADWQYHTESSPWKTSKYFKEFGFDILACPWKGYGNVRSALDTVRSEDLFGLLETTWHTLSASFPDMVYALANAYRQNENFEKNQIPRLYTAELLRKIGDRNRTYEDYGWCKSQVTYDIW